MQSFKIIISIISAISIMPVNVTLIVLRITRRVWAKIQPNIPIVKKNKISKLPLIPTALLIFSIIRVNLKLASYYWIASSIIIVLLITDLFDFHSWIVVYELSIIGVISALTVEGRSWRRGFALILLFIASGVGTAGIFCVLSECTHNCFDIELTTNTVFVCMLIAFLIKTPTFPFSIWLPEAHVEASVIGSVSLAAFGLKFSLFGLMLFGSIFTWRFDFIVFSLLSGSFIGVIQSATLADAKKILAQWSVVHMSLSVILILYLNKITSDWQLLSWAQHSLTAGIVFALIGIFMEQKEVEF